MTALVKMCIHPCKSFWIKASAKCNVKCNILPERLISKRISTQYHTIKQKPLCAESWNSLMQTVKPILLLSTHCSALCQDMIEYLLFCTLWFGFRMCIITLFATSEQQNKIIANKQKCTVHIKLCLSQLNLFHISNLGCESTQVRVK